MSRTEDKRLLLYQQGFPRGAEMLCQPNDPQGLKPLFWSVLRYGWSHTLIQGLWGCSPWFFWDATARLKPCPFKATRDASRQTRIPRGLKPVILGP